MSLKAKIEAVIYASEEPVTLAQLAGLLGQEAQAELDHLDSAQQTLGLDETSAEFETGDHEVLNSEVLVESDEVPANEEATPGNPEEAVAEGADDAELSDGLETPETDEIRHADLERHLHEAAEAEAVHLRAMREHEHADTAAMSSAEAEDSIEPASPEEAAAEKSETTAGAEEQPEAVAVDDGSEAVEPVDEPVDEKRLAREAKERERRLREYFRILLDELIREYATSDRGLEIREVAGGFRLATKPEYHDAVRGFVKSLKPPMKLSLQALETLAVVAYKQPVTAPEVSEIRGVDSGGVLGSLMTRKLVATAGRKQVIGRPILYKTTKEFLLRFGLKDISELPSIEEFEKLAGELAEQEEIPMQHHAPESPSEVEQEKDEVEPQADGDSNDLNETVAEEAIVDGRISGLPPNYDSDQAVEGADSPALDAEIQSGEKSE